MCQTRGTLSQTERRAGFTYNTSIRQRYRDIQRLTHAKYARSNRLTVRSSHVRRANPNGDTLKPRSESTKLYEGTRRHLTRDPQVLTFAGIPVARRLRFYNALDIPKTRVYIEVAPVDAIARSTIRAKPSTAGTYLYGNSYRRADIPRRSTGCLPDVLHSHQQA